MRYKRSDPMHYGFGIIHHYIAKYIRHNLTSSLLTTFSHHNGERLSMGGKLKTLGVDPRVIFFLTSETKCDKIKNGSGGNRYPEDTINGGGCFPSSGTQILFAFPSKGEVVPMFVTWELLFLFAGLIISLLTYIDNHNKKK